MRDATRIPALLARLEVVWAANPDLRLGQMMANTAADIMGIPDPFYIEDDQLMQVLERVHAPDQSRPRAKKGAT